MVDWKRVPATKEDWLAYHRDHPRSVPFNYEADREWWYVFSSYTSTTRALTEFGCHDEDVPRIGVETEYRLVWDDQDRIQSREIVSESYWTCERVEEDEDERAMTTRQEIEAAAAKAGLRVTGWHYDPAGSPKIRLDFGSSHHVMREGNKWRPWSANGIGFRPVTLDEALAAIAADIDEIASVRVRPAADVEAAREQGRAEGRAAAAEWLRSLFRLSGDPVYSHCAHMVELGKRSFESRAVSPEPSDWTDAAPDPDPLALPEGMEWRQDGNVWDVWEGSVLVGMAWPVYGRWKWACFAEQSGVLEAQDEHSARCALAAHLRERAGEER